MAIAQAELPLAEREEDGAEFRRQRSAIRNAPDEQSLRRARQISAVYRKMYQAGDVRVRFYFGSDGEQRAVLTTEPAQLHTVGPLDVMYERREGMLKRLWRILTLDPRLYGKRY